MTRSVNAGLVRLFNVLEPSQVCGAGFLVAPRTVCTCAHVVAEALGAGEGAYGPRPSPKDRVRLDFPQVAPGHSLWAQVTAWSPIGPDGEGDVAILTLDDEPLADVQSVPLLDVDPDDLWRHPFIAFGFPAGFDRAVVATGVIRTASGRGLVQLDGEGPTGFRVEGGFSGGPVWDEEFRAVVGMVATTNTEPEAKVGFMIPTRALLGVYPALPTIPWWWRSALQEPQSEVMRTLLALTEPELEDLIANLELASADEQLHDIPLAARAMQVWREYYHRGEEHALEAAISRIRPVTPPDAPEAIEFSPDYGSVSFQRWPAADRRTRGIQEVLGEWNAVGNGERLLLLVTHFPADVAAAMIAIEVLVRDHSARWTNVRHLNAGNFHQDGENGAGTTGMGPLGCILADLAERPLTAPAAQALVDEIRQWSPTLFLIDCTALPGAAAPGSAGESASLRAATWTRQCADALARRVSGSGHRVVLAMHRALLAQPPLHETLQDCELAFVARDLFDRYEHTRASGAVQVVDRTNLPPEVLPLLFANSSTLGRAVREFFHEGAWDEVQAAGASPDSYRLIALAAYLHRRGYTEIAFRLELHCRTRALVERTVGLSADIHSLEDNPDPGVGLLDNASDLPACFRRAVVVGPTGAGKSTVLQQVEHRWALPRWSITGIRHPAWLPLRLDFQHWGRQPCGQVLARAIGEHVTLDAEDRPFGVVPLEAHGHLADVLTLRNAQWLLGSPVLVLVDGPAGLEDDGVGSCATFLTDLHREAPTNGIVLALREGEEPYESDWFRRIFAHGGLVRLHPLTSRKAAALLGRGNRPDELLPLFGVPEWPVCHAVRNPFLLSCIRELNASLDELREWNLFRLLDAWITLRFERIRDEETRAILHGEWLPELAATAKQGEDPSPDPRLLRAAQNTGLVRKVGDVYAPRFVHELVADYFIASGMAAAGNDAARGAVEQLVSAPPPRWQSKWTNVLRLLVGAVPPSVADGIVAVIAARDLRVAQTCALELGASMGRELPATSDVSKRLAARLNVEANEIAMDRGAVKRLHERIRDAHALSYLDPRLDLDRPTQGMVTITGEASNAAFLIGRYPVTNLEFSRFVAAGGYVNGEHWSPEGWAWLRRERVAYPACWFEHGLNAPNQPVVGVALAEAMAYTRWLTRTFGNALGYVFALPTPEQWDQALELADDVLAAVLRARSAARRGGPVDASSPAPEAGGLTGEVVAAVEANLEQHPLVRYHRWLNGATGERAGAAERDIRTRPVGIVPPTESGCYDLLGYLWEWCVGTEGPDGIHQDQTGYAETPAVGWAKGGPVTGSTGIVWTVLGGQFDLFTRFHKIGFRVCANTVNDQEKG